MHFLSIGCPSIHALVLTISFKHVEMRYDRVVCITGRGSLRRRVGRNVLCIKLGVETYLIVEVEARGVLLLPCADLDCS